MTKAKIKISLNKKKKDMLLRTLATLMLFITLIFASCAAEEKLEPVVTLGIPADESSSGTVQIDDFIYTMYSSYAELTSYIGSDPDIIIPDEADGKVVLSIGEKAFWNNTTLKSVKLPENLRYVDRYAFQKCTSLTTVEFNSRLETIDDYAFNQTAITELNFPVSLASIGKYSFSECVGFTTLTIPSRVETIGKYAFYSCTKLETVTLNERLEKLQDRLFYNCTSLKNIEIPKNITEIGDYVFAGCTALETITIPAEVTKIGEGQFHDTPNVTVITPNASAAATFCQKNSVKWREPDAK
jgi:hypothetical protein